MHILSCAILFCILLSHRSSDHPLLVGEAETIACISYMDAFLDYRPFPLPSPFPQWCHSKVPVSIYMRIFQMKVLHKLVREYTL